jgi:hypothetical protein
LLKGTKTGADMNATYIWTRVSLLSHMSEHASSQFGLVVPRAIPHDPNTHLSGLGQRTVVHPYSWFESGPLENVLKVTGNPLVN